MLNFCSFYLMLSWVYKIFLWSMASCYGRLLRWKSLNLSSIPFHCAGKRTSCTFPVTFGLLYPFQQTSWLWLSLSSLNQWQSLLRNPSTLTALSSDYSSGHQKRQNSSESWSSEFASCLILCSLELEWPSLSLSYSSWSLFHILACWSPVSS